MSAFCSLCIFTQTGIVLWSNVAASLREIVNEFVEAVLLHEQKAAGSMTKQDKILTWQFNNKFRLVFLAITSSAVPFQASLFLKNIRTTFIYTYDKELQVFYTSYNLAPFSGFDDKFTQCMQETIAGIAKNNRDHNGNDSDDDIDDDDDDDEDSDNSNKNNNDNKKDTKGKESSKNINALDDNDKKEEEKGKNENNEDIASALASLQAKAMSLRAANKRGPQSPKNNKSPSAGQPKQVSERKAAAQLSIVKGSSSGKNVNKIAMETEKLSSSALVAEDPTARKKRIFGLFKATLSDADLKNPTEKIRELLISRNVSALVADALCSSIKTSLVGIEQTIKNPRKAVYEGMVQAISGMISRNRYDLMEKVKTQTALIAEGKRTKPFSIVFAGVNGVGKSTSLSKVAYLLKMNEITPMICACDTFRSGAIEQLRRHTDALDLELYGKGYGKSPDTIMKSAVAYAITKGIRCILVDTAGRMQNNKALMDQLNSLVDMNEPDVILFVGEALCGEDIMDQIREYDSSLKTHKIDAVLLSKYDCVSNNTGGLLNVIYELKKPIAFVGTGQRYNDLVIPTPEMLVETLLSKV